MEDRSFLSNLGCARAPVPGGYPATNAALDRPPKGGLRDTTMALDTRGLGSTSTLLESKPQGVFCPTNPNIGSVSESEGGCCFLSSRSTCPGTRGADLANITYRFWKLCTTGCTLVLKGLYVYVCARVWPGVVVGSPEVPHFRTNTPILQPRARGGSLDMYLATLINFCPHQPS